MTSLEYTNSIEGLVNDFVNGASDEKEFKVGILDVLTKARDDFFGKIPKPATKEMINFLLVNALRLLSKEQQRMLAKEISDRASEAGVQPEVIASERSSANGAVADVVNQLRDEFDRMINGYKTVHIGYGIEVANCQFLEKQSVDNYFSNILPGYLEKLLRVTASL